MRKDSVGVFIIDLEAAGGLGNFARDDAALLFLLGQHLVFCKRSWAVAGGAEIHIMDRAVFIAGIGGDGDRTVFDFEIGFCADDGKLHLCAVFLQPCGIVSAIEFQGKKGSAEEGISASPFFLKELYAFVRLSN